MYDIITVGEILVEILTENVNQPLDAPGKLLGPYPSGAPAIAIDQCAKMGAKAAIIAKIGKDDFGRLNKERLAKSGVDVSHIVETSENTTGVAFVTYFKDGSRKFIYHFEKAACGELCADDVDPSIIASAKYLHIMGCTITASPQLAGAVMKAVHATKSGGTKISFDPNIRPELLRGEIMDFYNEILDISDVLLAGAGEFKTLFGENEDNAITELLAKKERIIVIKSGSAGTRVYMRSDAFAVPIYPTNETDPTGAGDSFDGAFLAELCAGASVRDAVKFGNAAGALAVSKRGPMEGNAGKDEIESYVARHKRIEAYDIN